MTALLRPVTALMLSTAILLLGTGLIGVLLPISAAGSGFSAFDIGAMGSAYYVGLVAGCLIAPVVIGRVGHIRAFVAFTATVTITPLLHAMWNDIALWWVLRAVNGLCLAGLLMIIESWLMAVSGPATRGRVLGIYTLLHLTVVTLGMQLLALDSPAGFVLFSLVAILYSLAAVPVALTTSPAPPAPRRARVRLKWLISVSPAAAIGCFLTGLANSVFWMMGPLFGQGAGLSTAKIALFLSVAVIAGAAAQWPAGYLSDVTGRRPVLAGLAGVAAVSGFCLYALAEMSGWVLYGLAALYGIAAFPIYTVFVAHANDLVHQKRAVEVSGGLLLVFSLAAIIGPVAASLFVGQLGTSAIFLATASAHAVMFLFLILRVRVRPKLPRKFKVPFVSVPRTTPAVFQLDPRGEPAAEATPVAAGASKAAN